MLVGVYIREAEDAEDANAQAKLSRAYRQILEEYPSSKWDRRWLRTIRHNVGPSDVPRPAQSGSGAWMVEFEVIPRQN